MKEYLAKKDEKELNVHSILTAKEGLILCKKVIFRNLVNCLQEIKQQWQKS